VSEPDGEYDHDVCPVCAKFTQDESSAAELSVIAGVKAMLERDNDAVLNLFETASPYDAHVAVSLYMYMLNDLCWAFGYDVYKVLDHYRRVVLQRYAQADAGDS
jgi:hypothetical protein